jgi:hypothetical protein
VPLPAPLAIAIVLLGAAPPAPPPPRLTASGDVAIVSATRSAALAEPALAVAFLDDNRVAVLSPFSISLHKLDRSRFVPVTRRELPFPRATVRTPGGVLLPGDDACWALTSGMTRAVLYALEGDRLVERGDAEALPWPEAAHGLRFREGTNLLEDGGTLLLTPRVDGFAVNAAARLVELSPTVEPGAVPAASPRVGGTLAGLGGGRVAVSSPSAPGTPDRIQIFERRGDGLQKRGEIALEGTVRALAARRSRSALRIAAAVETAASERMVLVVGVRISP